MAEEYDDRITTSAERGQHVQLTCRNHPRLRWSTKNIAPIGCRTIFYALSEEYIAPPECDCSASLLVPVADFPGALPPTHQHHLCEEHLAEVRYAARIGSWEQAVELRVILSGERICSFCWANTNRRVLAVVTGECEDKTCDWKSKGSWLRNEQLSSKGVSLNG